MRCTQHPFSASHWTHPVSTIATSSGSWPWVSRAEGGTNRRAYVPLFGRHPQASAAQGAESLASDNRGPLSPRACKPDRASPALGQPPIGSFWHSQSIRAAERRAASPAAGLRKRRTRARTNARVRTFQCLQCTTTLGEFEGPKRTSLARRSSVMLALATQSVDLK